MCSLSPEELCDLSYLDYSQNGNKARSIISEKLINGNDLSILISEFCSIYLTLKKSSPEVISRFQEDLDLPSRPQLLNSSLEDMLTFMDKDSYQSLDDAFKSIGFLSLDKVYENFKKLSSISEAHLEEIGITNDEAVTIHSYCYPGSDAPYHKMNKALAERNDNAIRNCRGYILHLMKALRKLKPIKTIGTTLYRGIDGKYLKFDDEHYKEGNALTWPAFTSTTQREESAYAFSNRAEQPIIFEIHGDFVGYDIKMFSRYPKEEEVLLEPETKFKVVSIKQDTINSKAKRIVVEVQNTPLIAKAAVKNFERAESNALYQSGCKGIHCGSAASIGLNFKKCTDGTTKTEITQVFKDKLLHVTTPVIVLVIGSPGEGNDTTLNKIIEDKQCTANDVCLKGPFNFSKDTNPQSFQFFGPIKVSELCKRNNIHYSSSNNKDIFFVDSRGIDDLFNMSKSLSQSIFALESISSCVIYMSKGTTSDDAISRLIRHLRVSHYFTGYDSGLAIVERCMFQTGKSKQRRLYVEEKVKRETNNRPELYKVRYVEKNS